MSINTQYLNSTKLVDLITSLGDRNLYKNQYFLFEKIAMNIDTSTGFGLDLFGRKLGLTRNFLFSNENSNIILDDINYRKLILWELLKIHANSSTYDIDFLLNYFFENRGQVNVIKIKDQTMRLQVFIGFDLTPFEYELLVIKKNTPIPMGVYIENFVIVPDNTNILGFDGQDLGNLTNANFFK